MKKSLYKGFVSLAVIAMVFGVWSPLVTLAQSLPANNTPQGYLDTANCDVIAGWAVDPDEPTAQIAVHIYKNGSAGSGTFVAATTANLNRADVGDHAFQIATPAELKNGQAQTLYAHAIDTSGNGLANVQLSLSPKTFTCAQTYPELVITTSSLANAQVGTAYSATLTATGGSGNNIWLKESGTLPTGITLSEAGVISGTPTTAGTHTIGVYARSGNGSGNEYTRKTLTLVVDAAASESAVITTSTLANGQVGQVYSATVDATGGSGSYIWSVSSGALPAGLALTARIVCRGGICRVPIDIAGTPTTAGTSTFTMQLVSGSETVTKQYTLTVAAASTTPAALVITTSSLTNATVGTAYSATLTATGGSGSNLWLLQSGTLPAGLTLSQSGTISGTPTTAGTSTFTAYVRSGNGSGNEYVNKQLTLVVDADTSTSPLGITTSTVANGQVGQAYTATINATGGTDSYVWSVVEGTMPAGLTLTNATCVTAPCKTPATISGTPTTSGSSSFKLKVVSGNENVTVSLNMYVSNATIVSKISASLDSSSPLAKTFLAGTSGNTVASYKVSNLASAATTVNTLLFMRTGTTDCSGTYKLYDGSTLLGSTTSSGVDCSFRYESLNVSIAESSTKVFTLQIDLPASAASAKFQIALINVVIPGQTAIFDVKSETMTVQSITTNANTVKLSLPNGGEELKLGATQKITWTDSNYGIDNVYSLYLVRGNNQVVGTIAENLTNVREYNWKVGEYGLSTNRTSVVAGSGYSIELVKTESGTVRNADVTDASFSIVTTIVAENRRPIGYVDLLTQDGHIYGWAADMNHPEASINVHIYFDGPAGSGTFGGSAMTTLERVDVNQAMGTTGVHGFRFAIPAEFRDGKPHTVYVHAIDLDDATGSSNDVLKQSGQRFTLTSTTEVINERHPRGTVVIDRQGGVWFLGAVVRYPFPNPEIFKSWGHTWESIVAANEFDLAMPHGPAVEFKTQ